MSTYEIKKKKTIGGHFIPKYVQKYEKGKEHKITIRTIMRLTKERGL